jgi:hypothetical protein
VAGQRDREARIDRTKVFDPRAVNFGVVRLDVLWPDHDQVCTVMGHLV